MQYIRSEYSIPKWERDLKKLQRKNKYKTKKIKPRFNKNVEAYKRRENLLKSSTPAERSFAFLLRQNKLWYEEQHIYFLNNRNYRIFDFYIPKLNIAIEVDGGYHDFKQAKEYDIWKDRHTKIHVLRISNELALNQEVATQLIQHLLTENYKTFGKTLDACDKWRF